MEKNSTNHSRTSDNPLSDAFLSVSPISRKTQETQTEGKKS